MSIHQFPSSPPETLCKVVVSSSFEHPLQVVTNLDGDAEVRLTPASEAKLTARARDMGLPDAADLITALIMWEIEKAS